LILDTNDKLRGESIVLQAIAMSAEVFAYYSFPRHMSNPTLSQRRDVMRVACEKEGKMSSLFRNNP